MNKNRSSNFRIRKISAFIFLGLLQGSTHTEEAIKSFEEQLKNLQQELRQHHKEGQQSLTSLRTELQNKSEVKHTTVVQVRFYLSSVLWLGVVVKMLYHWALDQLPPNVLVTCQCLSHCEWSPSSFSDIVSLFFFFCLPLLSTKVEPCRMTISFH